MLPLLLNSPSNSNACEFQDNWFTAKFRYLQIPQIPLVKFVQPLQLFLAVVLVPRFASGLIGLSSVTERASADQRIESLYDKIIFVAKYSRV